MKQKKYEYIKSSYLAGFLMMNKFELLAIHHDLDNPTRKIYVFEQTEKLTEKILEYINRRTRGK